MIYILCQMVYEWSIKYFEVKIMTMKGMYMILTHDVWYCNPKWYQFGFLILHGIIKNVITMCFWYYQLLIL